MSKGLEEVVEAELRTLKIKALKGFPGIVPFEASMQQVWSANLYLRAARRILLPVGRFQAKNRDALYEGVRRIDWKPYLTPKHTLAVEASVRDAFTGHSGYVALKVKDAVVDACRDAFGDRPSVDRRNPDLRILVHIQRFECTISLDTSGGPLHKRGYRILSHEAPLNETLAAGIVLLSGYDGSKPFCDPMCGSGTLAIEAALIATNTAPGLLRRHPFGFERWPDFEPGEWELMKQEALESIRAQEAPILGSDIDPLSVDLARSCAKMAGMGWIKIETCDLTDFTPPRGPGILCTNPPYGNRMDADEPLSGLYRSLGDVLKQKGAGYKAHVLTGNPALGKRIGLRTSRRIPLYNGPTPCKLLVYKMYEGSKKMKKGPGEPGPSDS